MGTDNITDCIMIGDAAVGLIGTGIREVCTGRTVEEALAGVGHVLYDADGNHESCSKIGIGVDES